MLIYPAIDLRAGECVRLLHGRFDAVTRYDADPLARLAAFEAAGAEWVHIVDLDGAEAGEPRQHDLIARLAAAARVRIQTGGGVRRADDVARLLDAGAERVVVGSLAVRQPDTVIEWLDRFGAERLTLALDVRMMEGAPMVATDGWTKGSGLSLWQALHRLSAGRPKHVLVTEISRDGALEGPDLDLAAEIVRRAPDLAYQASGGVSSLADLAALKAVGATGAIVGRALYEGRFTLEEALLAG
ncbi:1-(5-phosphoribosyl)-5-[(5-phosphoribosylamino)methylideneamino]imidazole-4-carboxamide isomerase [Brevundimonas sp. 2R-24]|uniref:1-(5-phosphoribosyl)-5-[(5-phosphoribosylamino)methylideneamino] imidazole-4-carboxamide isomerase n=1 Tax=Peiella sedimenti TaxID=3061083 RepID=A0ABT8SL61_9CAUL|nr:1-(5-phosphoribosyl)-5-[(5-phosphoribosylamino)methylideneamino]imidazole-4-carboxamide isomerase [Caulobacteraceae bacterium XZ-24]